MEDDGEQDKYLTAQVFQSLLETWECFAFSLSLSSFQGGPGHHAYHHFTLQLYLQLKWLTFARTCRTEVGTPHPIRASPRNA